MQIRKAERKRAKIKMALQGSAGSGKTYSSLLIAYGLCKDWNKIVIIDTENSSSDLYSNLGSFNVLSIDPPFTPEKYIQAIELAEKAKMEVVILDSISHGWDCLLEIHSNMAGNSFTNWSKITPRQNAFIHKILQSPVHIIATMRVKQDYVLNQKDGKYVPEKVGLKAVQRDGVDYEFTIVLDVNIKNQVTASKDRSGLFMSKPAFTITPETGEQILHWCNGGSDEVSTVKSQIESCKSLEELKVIYNSHPETHDLLLSEFNTKKNQLSAIHSIPSPQIQKFNNNGSFTINRAG